MKRLTFLLVLLLTAACLFAAQPASRALDGLDPYIAQGMKDFEVPGLAMAVVKDGEVILAKGYGVRKLGEPAAVDENTVFGIASLSKAFTAAALAILVDEGKLRWDDRVIDHLPAFQLHDPYASREMTVRDLLCHRSGLPAYGADLLSFGFDRPRAEVLQRLRFLKPASSFRSKYAYQNNMFLVAGELIPAITGKSWDDFVSERILARLKMTSSSTRYQALDKVSNRVTPHFRIDGKLTPVVWQKVDGVGPAASINSCVRDMTAWMRVQLGSGALPNGRLFSEAAWKEMTTPQMVAVSTRPKKMPQPKFSAYGLGWSLVEYRGRKVATHGGALTGMFSRILLVPEEKIGVVVLSNAEGSLPLALAYRVVDSLLGEPVQDWSAAYLESARADEARNRERLRKQDAARAKDSRPSLAISGYAGGYTCPLLGDARLEAAGDKLKVVLDTSPVGTGEAEHWQYNTFLVRWADRTVPRAFLTFHFGHDGKAESFTMEMAEEGDPSYDFENYEFRRKEANKPE